MKLGEPPRPESQPTKERSPEYVKTLGEFEQILGKPEEEQKFIEKRITALSEKAESGEMSHVGLAFIKGFLGPEMEKSGQRVPDKSSRLYAGPRQS